MTGPPLSPGQLAIWYEEQLRTGFSNTGYFAATIAGDLAEEVVARACRAIVGRHPALRTLVAVTGGRPALSPRPADAGIAYEMVPLPCPPGGERAAVRAWRATSGKLAFDLTAEPPIAFTLLRHGPGRRTLLVVVHHICFDGRSKFVFAREFTGALRALSAGLPFDPPPVPSPSWPGESAELIGEAAGYWAGIVPDCPPLVLPLAEHPSGAAPSAAASLGAAPSAAASLRAAPSAPACLRAAPEFTVGAEQRRRLAGLAADGGTTLFGGLLAVLAAQLHAYGNERAVLSVPVDVSTAGTRDLIGPAVNVVPVALDLPRAATFRSLLAASAAAGATIKRYRRVPFRELAAGRPWSAGARALFAQLSLSWLRLPAELPEVPGLDVAWDFVAPNTAPTFACAIQARDAGDHLVLRFDHAGASLDSAAADEMAALFRETTAAVLAAPDRPLSGPDRPPSARPPDRPPSARPPDRPLSGPDRPPSAKPPDEPMSGPDRRRRRATRVATTPWRGCPDGPEIDPRVAAVAGPCGTLTYGELSGFTVEGEVDLPGLARALGLSPAPGACDVPAAVLRWQAAMLAPVRTLADPGSPGFWRAALLTWAAGGTLQLPPGVRGVTTVVAPYRFARRLLATGPPTALRDVVVPVDELLPAAELGALVRAGVRLHAEYAPGTGGTVAMGEITAAELTGHLAPALTRFAPGAAVEIRGPNGRRLPRCVPGEIVVADRPATGDLGWVDRAGSLRPRGPLRGVLRRAGRALNALDVERRLASHPAVADVVVTVGAGEPVAYVVPRSPGLDAGRLRRHLRGFPAAGELRLARIELVAALPAG